MTKSNHSDTQAMDMKTVVLHVGMHKTASTYIQNRLRRNGDLLSRNQWLYPPLRRHHLALVQAVRKQDPAPWKEWMKQAEANHCRLLLSAEAFSVELAKSSSQTAGETPGQWLHQMIRQEGWNLKVVTFVRDQPSYLNSRYTQLVKRLHTTSSFNNYVRRVAKGNTESECDMMTLFAWILNDSALQSVFIPFGGSLASPASSPVKKADPFEQLVAQLNLPDGLIFAAAPPSSANQQPGELGVRLARRLGRYLKRHQPEMLKQSDQCMAARKQIERWAAARQWTQTPYNGLTPALWQAIRTHYEASNASFTKAAWGDQHHWSTIFGGEPSWPVTPADPKQDSVQLKPLLERLLRLFQPQTP